MEAVVLQCFQSGQPWGPCLPFLFLDLHLPFQSALHPNYPLFGKPLEGSLNGFSTHSGHGAKASSCRGVWSSWKPSGVGQLGLPVVSFRDCPLPTPRISHHNRTRWSMFKPQSHQLVNVQPLTSYHSLSACIVIKCGK